MVDIAAGALQEAAPLVERSKYFATLANSVSITTSTQADEVAKVCGEIKATFKRVEDARKKWTDPLNAVVKSINEAFRPALESLKAAEHTLKASLAHYSEAEARALQEQRAAAAKAAAAQAEQARLAQAAATAKLVQAPVAGGAHSKASARLDRITAEVAAARTAAAITQAKALEEVTPVLTSAGTRQKLAYEIMDLEALVLWCVENNRRDLLMINEKILKATLDDLPATVKGIKVYLKTTVVIRGAK